MDSINLITHFSSISISLWASESLFQLKNCWFRTLNRVQLWPNLTWVFNKSLACHLFQKSRVLCESNVIIHEMPLTCCVRQTNWVSRTHVHAGKTLKLKNWQDRSSHRVHFRRLSLEVHGLAENLRKRIPAILPVKTLSSSKTLNEFLFSFLPSKSIAVLRFYAVKNFHNDASQSFKTEKGKSFKNAVPLAPPKKAERTKVSKTLSF